ncbi:DUF2087 domain-containing protein [Fundicoccus ignavus]|uniref:DUF2087 domain-containing protein n=1 Tax=Fundicoccus ignavus TaxID=2664442 RepID=UPI001C12AA6A
MLKRIERYFKEGKLTVFPRKEKNKLDVLQYFVQLIESKGEGPFTEKEINAIISDVYGDYSTIRRALVDYGYLLRDDYGAAYRLNDAMAKTEE